MHDLMEFILEKIPVGAVVLNSGMKSIYTNRKAKASGQNFTDGQISPVQIGSQHIDPGMRINQSRSADTQPDDQFSINLRHGDRLFDQVGDASQYFLSRGVGCMRQRQIILYLAK